MTFAIERAAFGRRQPKPNKVRHNDIEAKKAPYLTEPKTEQIKIWCFF